LDWLPGSSGSYAVLPDEEDPVAGASGSYAVLSALPAVIGSVATAGEYARLGVAVDAA
jgi:hypothetical protein